MSNLRPFIRLLKPHRDWILWALFCGLLTLVSSVGLLAVSGWFLSATAVAGLSMVAAQQFNIFTPSAAIRGFAVLRTGGRYAERVLAHEATLRLLSSLRVWFYRAIEPQAPANLCRRRSGDLLSRIVSDIDTLDSLYVRVLAPTLIALGIGLTAGGLLLLLAPSLALSFLLFFVAAGLLLPLLTRRLGRPVGARIQQQSALMRTNLLEDLQGLGDLTLYGALDRHYQRRLKENEELLGLQEKMTLISGLGSALMILLSSMAAIVTLYLAIPMAQQERFDGTFLALIAFGVLAAFEAVLPLPQAWQMLGRITVAGGRILEIVETPPAVSFAATPAKLPAAYGICLDQVSFRYPHSTAQCLDRVSFRVPARTSLALIGPSGCGKSTLVHLLTRFWDADAGEIRIGNRDIRLFSENQLREMVTLVSQKAHIFNTSLRDNLLIAAPQAEDAQLWDALERAQLADFVARLPAGLETRAGELGTHLSGGQGRRLVLTRALLKEAPVWLLDEPTEGLDAVTARRFCDTLLPHLQEKTALVITHDARLLAALDQVCLMERGTVVATGVHGPLLEQSSRYRAFVQQKNH